MGKGARRFAESNKLLWLLPKGIVSEPAFANASAGKPFSVCEVKTCLQFKTLVKDWLLITLVFTLGLPAIHLVFIPKFP